MKCLPDLWIILLKRNGSTIVRALRIGELLIAKKQELGHGNWLTWFTKNIHFSIDTYENYKRLYERREELKLANVQTLDEAYKLIRYANRDKKASKAKTVAKATTIESDNQAELKRLVQCYSDSYSR